MAGDPAGTEKLIFALQNDLKTLSLETKKKHGFVKDAAEEAIAKIRAAQSSHPTNSMAYITNQALYPVIQGCDTKDPKIVKLCLHSIQKLITGGHVDGKGARSVYETAVALLEGGMEEIKVLQTVTLLLTTNDRVKGELLAKNLVLCFRLHCSKDLTTAHAAGATVRQLVSLVFERIDPHQPPPAPGTEELSPEASDAYLLFQDLIFLVNGEHPTWLVGISEMFRTFGLELLETILARFPFVFEKYDQFSLLLKERVCAMVIKLFSPNAKFKANQHHAPQYHPHHHVHGGGGGGGGYGGATAADLLLDKPFYPTSVRLLRIVDILITKYYSLLVTECEIFLSLLVRFLDPDKPTWQRCLALEVLHKLITSPQHLAKFCRSYDLKPHATNICKDMVNALGAYVQSVFANPLNGMGGGSLSSSSSGGGSGSGGGGGTGGGGGGQGSGGGGGGSGGLNVMMNGGSGLPSSSSSPGDGSLVGFYFRGSFVPLIHIYQPSTPKPQLMELTDKQEPPGFGTCESYGVAISFACLSDFVLSLVQIERDVEEGQVQDAPVLKQLLTSSWPGLLAALNLLLEASIDDGITETICERLVDLATLSGKAGLQQCREATVLSLCVATLPPHYGYAVLKGTIGHGESPHPISYSEMDNGKQQVVVVGTSVVPSLALPPSLQSTPVMLTKKNLLVTHSVLRLCLESGPILLTSWLTLLTTLQHLCWVCGIVAKSSADFISNQVTRLGIADSAKSTSSSSAHPSSSFTSLTLTNNTITNSSGESGYSTSSSMGWGWTMPPPSSHGGSSIIGGGGGGGGGMAELSISSSKGSNKLSSGGGSGGGSGKVLNGSISLTSSGSSSVSSSQQQGGVMGVVVDFVGCLSGGVMRLIETSVALDDVSLHHVINALTNLSQEAMEIAYSNREPSLFAVAKLLEIGLVNLDRVEIYWRPLTNHLLEVCRHPHIRMREWGSEAITFLVRSALLHEDSPSNSPSSSPRTPGVGGEKEQGGGNEGGDGSEGGVGGGGGGGERVAGQGLLLSPLCELSTVPHNDVRNKQLMALSQILHCKGDKLRSSWPLAINILGDIYDNHSEGQVRSAFQCLQLVVTDYLPVLPSGCIPQSIHTVAKFARQKQELNVALSAIGLMWNIADFLYQNRIKILENMSPDVSVFPDFPGISDTPQFDRLWLGIYQRLGELCVDERPAVRKSSGQTLFSTIAAHSNILSKYSWDSVMWSVLFPLLEQVEKSWKSASSEKVDGGQNTLLIHHSRNTEQKQWSETQVLVLGGISKIFSIKRAPLLEIQDFQKAWFFFLQFVQNGAMSSNDEVSLAALKSFQESLLIPTTDPTPPAPEPEEISKRSWIVYLDIGEKVIIERGAHQHFLAAYVTIFQYLFPPLKSKLTIKDLSKLNQIIAKSLVIPLSADGASSILFSSSDSGMTPLQDQIYHAYDIIIRESMSSTPKLKELLPTIILQLIDFGAYAVRNTTCAKGIPLEGVIPNCMEFGVKSLKHSVAILGNICTEKNVVGAEFFKEAMQKFRPILASRFLNSEGAWRECAAQFFLAVPLMVDQGVGTGAFWLELSSCASEFLFFSSGSGDWMTKKGWKDEKMDVRMVALLKELVFRNEPSLSPQFLIEVVKIFHRGSCINEYDGINVSEREEFVRFCFSSLLEFVLKGPTNVSAIVEMQSGEDGKKIAVLALLQRFQNILLNYKEYVNHNSHIPIQRHRLAEMNFVLRAITSLIENLKTADPSRVTGGTWEHILGIYPDLVAIVGLPGVDTSISIALRDALLAYSDLLRLPDYSLPRPPRPQSPSSSSSSSSHPMG